MVLDATTGGITGGRHRAAELDEPTFLRTNDVALGHLKRSLRQQDVDHSGLELALTQRMPAHEARAKMTALQKAVDELGYAARTASSVRTSYDARQALALRTRQEQSGLVKREDPARRGPQSSIPLNPSFDETVGTNNAMLSAKDRVRGLIAEAIGQSPASSSANDKWTSSP